MTHCPKCGAAHLSTRVHKCSAEAIAERAVENAECAAQIEIKDAELRASLVRNFAIALQSPADRGTP